MIDVTDKPVIRRQAEAAGRISLSPRTIETMVAGGIRKGDPMAVAGVAGMCAAKQTHLLIPHCHQIALDAVLVTFEVGDASIEARCLVRARAGTGVEMEALVGVCVALSTIWDMVKYLEKDNFGQYPNTRITEVRVVRKEKDAGAAPDPHARGQERGR